METLNVKHYAHYFDEIIKKLIISVYYIRNVIKLKWWGINFSLRIKFDGPIIVKRLPSSNIKIGEGCYFSMSSRHNLIGINHPCILSTQNRKAKISIGDNCGFSGTTIGAFKSIIIKNNVKSGANTIITDGDWHLDDPRAGQTQEVLINDNVWLGVNTVILKGVSIGENTIIGANSVVTKSLPANVVAAGNPCVVLKKINTEETLAPKNMQQLKETVEETSF
ncbi:acyltransferase [uncultured Draconibacterium sp.]|uniref:acyltransferase n=1 Tax=uncultured Draconibacterium sp. TaxID=1573823 RepID=UPI002AA8E490|nr:acyltransferase [uncultured Draconibacterium sp.]